MSTIKGPQTIRKERMFFRRLIFTMLAAIWPLLPMKVSAAESAVSHGTLHSIDQNSHRPQWSDLGLENILATCGQSTVAPPSPVRLASNGRRVQGGNSFSSGGTSYSGTRRGDMCLASPSSAPGSNGVLRGGIWSREYLYIIRCLRL